MNRIELLHEQTSDAYSWLNRLLDTIPTTYWSKTPPELGSNVLWQIGHLIMSIYYHSVMAAKGHHPEVVKNISLEEYNYWFTMASPREILDKIDINNLNKQLFLVEKISLDTIKSLSEINLKEHLEDLQPSHPIASTKYESLDWNIKHTMWHCGQIALLSRIIYKRFDLNRIN